jgi:hypothetical protein
MVLLGVKREQMSNPEYSQWGTMTCQSRLAGQKRGRDPHAAFRSLTPKQQNDEMTMASDDFYSFSARQRLQQINAGRAQALPDLEAAKANADYDSAGQAVQQIADLDAEARNVAALHEQYVASQTPPPQQELSAAERAARAWDKMTWDDALDLARTSQFGKDLDHNDPHVQDGYREVMRRRARGE